MGTPKGTTPWNAGSGKGWINARGYRVVSVTTNGKRRQVTQHRFLMEQHLGRRLEPWEIVHHKDGNTLNNVLENLEVMTVGQHNIHHHVGSKRPEALRRSGQLFQSMTQEIKRLRRDNADLLAACESALARADFLGEITVAKTLRAAIVKATGGGK